MELNEFCNRIVELYEDTDKESQDRFLAYQLVYKLRLEINKENFTNESLEQILKAAKRIAISKGNLKQILEKEMLTQLGR